MTWCERQRMEWIAETLRVFGFIQRAHLMAKFEISMPQASKDLQTYMRLNPETMLYNPNEKKYVARSTRGRHSDDLPE